ncbi:MAG: flagellar hook-length control protein FliK [Kangiellaceae bacterium]|nr:flagellar hook-length control protein FliK [Kangiellaceae bacterium]MCW9016099.1 flagellar hook-length control protein FliK [Kangiellaceae bacterium]
MSQVQAGSVSQVLGLLFGGSTINAENTFKIKAQAIGVDNENFSEQLQLAVSQLLQNKKLGERGIDFDDEFLGQAEQFVNKGGKFFPQFEQDSIDLSQLDLSQLDLLAKELSEIEQWGIEKDLSEKELQQLFASFVDKKMSSLKQSLAEMDNPDLVSINAQLKNIDALEKLKEHIAVTLNQIKAASSLSERSQHEANKSNVIGSSGTTNAQLKSDSFFAEQSSQSENASRQSLESGSKGSDDGIAGILAKKDTQNKTNIFDRNLVKIDGENLSKEKLAKLSAEDLDANNALLDEKAKKVELNLSADKKMSDQKEKFSSKLLQRLDNSQIFAKDKTLSFEQQKVASLLPNADLEVLSSNGGKLHLNPASETFTSFFASGTTTATNEQTGQSINSVNTKLEPSSEFTQGLKLKQNFAPNLSMRIQWMFRQSLSSAEILMDPPEMGPLSVKVNKSNGEINILFQVSNLATKETLEDNLTKLKDMLEQQGINLGEAQVQHKESQLAEKENDETESSSEEIMEEESQRTETIVAKSEHLVDTYS